MAEKLFKSFESRTCRSEWLNNNSAAVKPVAGFDKMGFEKIKTYHSVIEEAGKEFNIDPALIYAVIQRESSGNPNTVSSKGAKGLMQLMDATAAEMGVSNSFNPAENIRGGTRYLRKMMDRFDNDSSLALAAYNSGPGTVRRYGGIPPFPETTRYVQKVQESHREFIKKLSKEKQVSI